MQWGEIYNAVQKVAERRVILTSTNHGMEQDIFWSGDSKLRVKHG